MAEIDTIRELHCYEKMYFHLLETVEECEVICKDLAVKERLIRVQQELEDIYTGENYKTHDYLTTDEKIIALLLSYIRQTELLKEPGQSDDDIYKEAFDWNITLCRANNPQIDEKMREHFYKVLFPEKHPELPDLLKKITEKQ